MGLPKAGDTLREALAMGADNAVSGTCLIQTIIFTIVFLLT